MILFKRLPPFSRLSRSPCLFSLSSHLPCTPATFSRYFFTSIPCALRYHPLPRPHSSRRHFFGFLDEIPQNTIFYGIIGLNATVFVMWFMSTQKYVCRIPILLPHTRPTSSTETRTGSIGVHLDAPELYQLLAEYFIRSDVSLVPTQVSIVLLDAKFLARWTPVTSCFSHKDVGHIFFNGFTFFFMAQPVLQMLGGRSFVFLYMGGSFHTPTQIKPRQNDFCRWTCICSCRHGIRQPYR
jgi:hypothetical protein